jgi:hypothetical protein
MIGGNRRRKSFGSHTFSSVKGPSGKDQDATISRQTSEYGECCPLFEVIECAVSYMLFAIAELQHGYMVSSGRRYNHIWTPSLNAVRPGFSLRSGWLRFELSLSKYKYYCRPVKDKVAFSASHNGIIIPMMGLRRLCAKLSKCQNLLNRCS